MNNSDTGGWIVLHRKITQWEWYRNATVKELFIHLLLTANHEDRQWQGIEIKKGQLVTSVKSLVQSTSLKTMQVRNALKRLILTNEITIKTTNRYTVVTVQNYSEYQSSNKQSNKRVTNKQQTNNKQITTNNNYNKLTNKQSITPVVPNGELERIRDFYNLTFQSNIASTAGFAKNFMHWRKVHTLEKIETAIRNARGDNFWGKTLTLAMLFRIKNRQGEDVDYIEDLANKGHSNSGSVAII